MCPIVPTFRCGLLRSNFSFDIGLYPLGARLRGRCRARAFHFACRPLAAAGLTMERGTGLEPATICLEGRDSTTELPPLMPWFAFRTSRTPARHSDCAARPAARNRETGA